MAASAPGIPVYKQSMCPSLVGAVREPPLQRNKGPVSRAGARRAVPLQTTGRDQRLSGVARKRLRTARRNCTASSTPHPNPLPEEEGTKRRPLPLRGEGGVRGDKGRFATTDDGVAASSRSCHALPQWGRTTQDGTDCPLRGDDRQWAASLALWLGQTSCKALTAAWPSPQHPERTALPWVWMGHSDDGTDFASPVGC